MTATDGRHGRQNAYAAMDEIDYLKRPQLLEAALLWTGWGRSPWPLRDASAVAQRFGSETSEHLLLTLKCLEVEFYTSDARFAVADPQEMGDMAAEQFRKTHPGIADEIVKAFAWCYTFDFK